MNVYFSDKINVTGIREMYFEDLLSCEGSLCTGTWPGINIVTV